MANQHLSEAQVCQLARDHGAGIPPGLLVAQAYQESGWQTDPTNGPNRAGAIGLMQVIGHFHPESNLYDPAVCMEVGAHVLAQNFYYLNHIRAGLTPATPVSIYPWDIPTWTTRALWGYVMGPGNVDYYDNHLDKTVPADVQGYAQNILRLWRNEGYCA